MPLFVCATPDCRTVDNTALTMFWMRHYEDEPVQCSACERGKWHGRWTRHTYDPKADIGSHANPERLFVDGEWINTPPRRVGHWQTVDGEQKFVYEDGYDSPHRPYTWIDGVPVWNDELENADVQG